MTTKIKSLLAGGMLLTCTTTLAQEAPSRSPEPRPDLLPPSGVPSSLGPTSGHFALSYQYGLILNKSLLDGSKTLKTQDNISPQQPYVIHKARSEHHTLAAVIQYSDQLRFRPHLDLISQRFEVVGYDFEPVRLQSSGVGDGGLDAIFHIFQQAHNPWHLQWHLGVSFPLGSHTDKGRSALGREQTLPQPWQAGTDQFFLTTGPAFQWFGPQYSFGFEALVKEPLSKGKGIRQNGSWQTSAWASGHLFSSFSTSLRLAHTSTSPYSNLEETQTLWGQSFAPNAGGLERTDLFFGVNTLFFDYRFAFEYGEPIAQRAKGILLKRRSYGVASWQYSY